MMNVNPLPNPLPLVSALQTFLYKRSDLNSNAIESLSKAIFEVEKYYRDLRIGEAESRERETAIAEFWRAAAEPVRRVDRDFASICERKVYYWLNPSQYSREEVLAFEMSLEGVKIKLQQLRDKN
ncbi:MULTISPECIES: hypothetical protein [Phytobacter]|uniref:Uncharacterized protein n=1 Tax=Phytobacter diazotrophicus TaxID=395631 RepID=A0ABN6LMH3_9ENTR|nr:MULTISPECIES: hypothetical protein [Phytobacter]BBE76902.1 hypothetical protein MRY16398_19580 [Phytobacter sp. MRY16-398]BDD50371.1 hypothetical protein PDTA9734_18580 [Phytobacter diazotrophicus]BEG81399.1 hypothetical protein PDTA9730_18550 [Phytobacter diazotrophicus]BEG87202.1 hypothetical protein PDTA9759_18580 [Phytobacter diazotrophicus]BEG92996.1 hypothetical protein PDTA9832_18550 [Phytobacter diazotrophicus]